MEFLDTLTSSEVEILHAHHLEHYKADGPPRTKKQQTRNSKHHLPLFLLILSCL